jgi:hypothetical protein
MLASQTFRTTFSIGITSMPRYSPELSRVFAAAVVNQQFCETLLQNPNLALQNGYFGESFLLSKEEKDLIISIRAESLSELAKKVNRALTSQN